MGTEDTGGGKGPPPAAEPSMEDILASIRRILNEDEKASGPQSPNPDDVLVLDQSMLVQPAGDAEQIPSGDRAAVSESSEEPKVTNDQPGAGQAHPGSLVAPEVAAAAATSVESLVRKLTERGALVSRNGPSLEDLVREEIRPILKDWLDANLPPLVERLVRMEIERLVARSAP